MNSFVLDFSSCSSTENIRDVIDVTAWRYWRHVWRRYVTKNKMFQVSKIMTWRYYVTEHEKNSNVKMVSFGNYVNAHKGKFEKHLNLPQNEMLFKLPFVSIYFSIETILTFEFFSCYVTWHLQARILETWNILFFVAWRLSISELSTNT